MMNSFTQTIPYTYRAFFAIPVCTLLFAAHSAKGDEPSSKVTAQDAGNLNQSRVEPEQRRSSAKPAETIAEMRRQLETAHQQLAERQSQLMAAQTLAALERGRELPPLENAVFEIYRLQRLSAEHAAKAIESLFGTGSMRVAVDERTNSLIVLGKRESLDLVEAMLTNLDEKAETVDKKQPPQQTAAKQSLLLRLFWLADGVPEGDEGDLGDVIPGSVLVPMHRAMQRLGLEDPRLITQTVTSLAVSGNDPAEFSANVRALLKGQNVLLEYGGNIKLSEPDKPVVAMHAYVSGDNMDCQLDGSMSMPLGHYMVLGTANSVMPEMTKTADAAVPPEGEVPPGGVGPGEMHGPQPPEAKLRTTRFAFVVQVIQAESFSPGE